MLDFGQTEKQKFFRQCRIPGTRLVMLASSPLRESKWTFPKYLAISTTGMRMLDALDDVKKPRGDSTGLLRKGAGLSKNGARNGNFDEQEWGEDRPSQRQKLLKFEDFVLPVDNNKGDSASFL
jgi:hypothetical protein